MTIEESIYTNVAALYEELKGNTTLRDKFAMAALQGIIANPDPCTPDPQDWLWIAERAYDIADAMLEARKK